MMLSAGTKLFAPDRGFGEKHGMVIKASTVTGEYVIKWDEIPQPLTYLAEDRVDDKVRAGIFEVVPARYRMNYTDSGLRRHWKIVDEATLRIYQDMGHNGIRVTSYSRVADDAPLSKR